MCQATYLWPHLSKTPLPHHHQLPKVLSKGPLHVHARITNWFDFVKVTVAAIEFMSATGCVMSEGHHFIAFLLILWLLDSFCPSSLVFYEPCGWAGLIKG